MYINPDIYDFDEIINQKRHEQYLLDKEIDAYAIAKAALIKEIPQDEINFGEIKEIYYSCEKNGGEPNESAKDKLNRLMAVFGIKESQYKFYAITFEGAFASFTLSFRLNSCKDRSVYYLVLPRFSKTRPSDAISSFYDYVQYVFGKDNGLPPRDDFYEYNTIMKSYDDIDEIKTAIGKELSEQEEAHNA